MIGGYIFHTETPEISVRLQAVLDSSTCRIPCGSSGFLFYDHPFSDARTAVYSSDGMTVLSHDLLVTRNGDGNYVALDLRKDFADLFRRKNIEAFKDIVSDYRLILIDGRNEETAVYLVSNRAGNGRMYYTSVDTGVLFASDLRFLLKIVPCEVSDVAVYAVLKYGAIPEPMTISHNVSAVPPAHYCHIGVRSGTYRTESYFQFDFPCDRGPSVAAAELDSLLQPAKARLRQSAHFLGQRDPAILLSGGIDSSLYALYLAECGRGQIPGIHCTFGDHDPELPFARALAVKVRAELLVGRMEQKDALTVMDDTVALTDHPFSDFSSLPITYILKFLKAKRNDISLLVEGNGGDDCFGFSALAGQTKMRVKALFPKPCKATISYLFTTSESWRVESEEGFLARVLALADVHEIEPLNYFLVLTPINFLGLQTDRSWDRTLTQLMDRVISRCATIDRAQSYQAQITMRQLLHVNSRRWAAKAFSVGESLGIRIVYPYIWRDILTAQGNIPWAAKINNGVIKWPLKRLLEEYMPPEFIYRRKSGFVPPFAHWLNDKNFNQTVRDVLLSSGTAVGRIAPKRIFEELLDAALRGRCLRHPVLNFLWGALFTEMWIRRQGGNGRV